MKKFLSMALALVLLFSAVALTSCSKPEETIKKADVKLEEESYRKIIKTNFSSSNAELNALLAAKNAEIPIVVDNSTIVNKNDSWAMKIDIENNTVGTISPVTFYVLDSALFLEKGMLKNDSNVQLLLSASDERRFFDAFNARFAVDKSHFGSCDTEGGLGKKTYHYSDITEDGEIELKYALRRLLIGIYDEYTLDLTDYSYSITMDGKKYEKIELSYTHNITVGGNTFSATVNMVAEFSYENIPDISEDEVVGYYKRVSDINDYL